MLLIEIALEFSKYDLLILQIKQMTIFPSLQSIKCSETVVRNNLEQLFFLKKVFYFSKTMLLSLGGWFNNIQLYSNA